MGWALGLGAVGLVAGVAVGFLAGLAVYAHVYANFIGREEEKAGRKTALAVQQMRVREIRLRDAKNRMMNQFPRMTDEQREVANEELERVLSNVNGRDA